MLFIHEELSRARELDLREEARAEAVAGRIASARRWQRRAEAAARRAQAAAAAVE